MRYHLKPIQCRPWTLSCLSVNLVESHARSSHRCPPRGRLLARAGAEGVRWRVGAGRGVLLVRLSRRVQAAIKLRDAGFDARYMNSAHSGWKAVGAPMRLAPSP